VIIVTGTDMRDLGEEDFACVLRKPITPEALTLAVERCLREAARGPQSAF
jgi:hypothetical protein